ASAALSGLWRPRKCSTTREVTSRLIDETKARPSAAGKTAKMSLGSQENPAKGGIEWGSTPISREDHPKRCEAITAARIPNSGAGIRGARRATTAAKSITIIAVTAGAPWNWQLLAGYWAGTGT